MNDRVANREGRASQLQDRMNNRGENQQDRQDRRDQNQQDRQDRRNENQDNRQERRDDWSENFWDNAYDMRHDYWDNRFDAWWDHMWDDHPVGMALGMTAWGVNRLSYWFGYGGGYSNPYYGDGGGGAGGYSGGGSYDYSQPLPTYEQVSSEPITAEAVAESPSGTAPSAPPAEGQSTALMTAFDETRQAFYGGDYKLAMDKVNAALALAPNDALLHEIKALILFAEGQYKDAAATIHTVLAVGPGWDWTTLSSMYPSVDAYTAQLRKLEDAVRANPNDAALHFLTAYHYITCNSTNEAVAQLRDVIRLQPNDTVALQLLEMLVGPQAAQSSASGAPPKAGSTAPEPAAVPAKDLVGDWKAKGDRGSNFELKLTDKNTFTWTYSEKGKSKSIEGVYAVEQNTLALQPDAGGTMAAEVTAPKDGKFHFQVVGAPAGDRGLDFAK